MGLQALVLTPSVTATWGMSPRLRLPLPGSGTGTESWAHEEAPQCRGTWAAEGADRQGKRPSTLQDDRPQPRSPECCLSSRDLPNPGTQQPPPDTEVPRATVAKPGTERQAGRGLGAPPWAARSPHEGHAALT